MNTNPRFALLLARYAQMDQITLILAGVALLIVLLGWIMLGRRIPAWNRGLYFATMIASFTLTMLGCAYLLIGG